MLQNLRIGFEQLVDFVAEQHFEHLGVFTYSVEDDTPAAKLPDRVPAKIAQRRMSDLMAVQQQIAFQWNQSRVGSLDDVIIDSKFEEQDGVWIGRTMSEAPEIDGVVYVSGAEEGAEPSVGDIVECEIVASQGYDLVAAPTGN